MSVPLQITYHGMKHSKAADEIIAEKVARMEAIEERMTSCRVVVTAPHKSQQKGNLFQVRIEVDVPGDRLVVSRDSEDPAHEDLAAAVRDAFETAHRMVRQHVERHHTRRAAQA